MRYLVADKIMEITEVVGAPIAREHFSSYFCDFLQDQESEVRTAAVRKLSEFCKILDT